MCSFFGVAVSVTLTGVTADAVDVSVGVDNNDDVVVVVFVIISPTEAAVSELGIVVETGSS